MNLFIMSPTAQHTYHVAWVEINTPAGNFIIQPGHAPTIFILSAQKPIIFRLENGKQEELMMHHGGIMDVTRTSATILFSL